MEAYNVRVYYYETGTQYRVYSRPVLKLTDQEKAQRKLDNTFFPKRKRSKNQHLEYNPFSDTMEKIEDIDTYYDRQQRASQVSLNRSKQNLIGICRANRWDYFITFTLSRSEICSRSRTP